METSTPLPSMSGVGRRISFSIQKGPLTPLKRDRPRMELGMLDESNDDIERAERRWSVALRKSILALPPASTDSPALNDSVRALTDEDLKSQLQTFCKLHAENKISAKNAWSLRVIDVLKQIVSKDNPDVLKVAGNSLEIAGKVYGLRVDDLHAEGLKLAGSLARNFASKGRDNNENEENQDPNAEAGQENQRKKRSSKKKRMLLSADKKMTVNADPEGFVGTLPKLESAAFSARTDTNLSATDNLFTNRVRMDPTGYKFMFASKEKAWDWKPGNDLSVKKEMSKKFPINGKSVIHFYLCAPFKDFRVDVWDPEEVNKDLLRKSSVLEDVVLDDNGIPIAELDGSIHDIFEERNDQDLDDDPIEEEVIAPLIQQDVEHIVDFRPTEQGLVSCTEKSAYSFNTIISTCSGKIDQIWAGPSHWKLKFIRRSQPVYSGQDRHEQKDQDKNKKKVTRKKNAPVPIDFWNLKPSIDLTKTTKRPNKKKNCLLDAQKITVPILEPSCIKLIENIEYLMTVTTMKIVKKKNKSQSELDYNVSGYNYNNPNDSDYCPQAPADDNGADLGDDLFDNADQNPISPNSQDGFLGNNLVDAPETVQQTYMHYATKAKKMDMKKLKQAVWCTLTNSSEYDTATKVVPTSFSKMYTDLPKMLPEKLTAELSCPIAFVALLHLCNEQNLALQKYKDITDFGIVGPGS